MNTIGIAVIFLYSLLILLASRGTARRTNTAAFYVNDRSSSAADVGKSIVVSCVGASATLGMLGMAFSLGTPAFWWLGAGAVGLTALSLLLAKRVRESEAYTMPQLVGNVLGAPARPLVALVITIAWTAILAAQFVALSQVLRSMTGFSYGISLAVGFFLIACHSLGGQAAVMRSHRIQTLVLCGTLIILLGWLWVRNPGWVAATPIEAVNKAFPPGKLVYYLVVVGANYLVCPMLFGRLLSARDAKSARLGGMLGAAGIAVCAAVIVSIGLACKGLIPPETPLDAVLTTALYELLPPWMHLVVSLALISAIVSSADSCLVTAGAVLSHDLFSRDGPWFGRACLLALGLSGALLSLWGKSIIGFLLMAYDIYACGVVVPVFLGMLLRGRMHVDPRAACGAVAVGGAFGLAAALTEQTLYSYLGLVISGGIVMFSAVLNRFPEWRKIVSHVM